MSPGVSVKHKVLDIRWDQNWLPVKRRVVLFQSKSSDRTSAAGIDLQSKPSASVNDITCFGDDPSEENNHCLSVNPLQIVPLWDLFFSPKNMVYSQNDKLTEVKNPTFNLLGETGYWFMTNTITTIPNREGKNAEIIFKPQFG